MRDTADFTDKSESAEHALQQIIESSRELGVEIDREEALQWLSAMAAHDGQEELLAVDEESGVFGHRVVMLDFDPSDMLRIRKVAAIVEIEDEPNVETAIALSGSSAQSQVQAFPGDFDYFERVNIKAASKEDACRILGQVIRKKGLKYSTGKGYQLIEVRFGTYQQDVVRDGDVLKSGSSITWSHAELEDGHIDVLTPDGAEMQITWDDACTEPGWCKLDWVLVDPSQPRAVKASNMLDATWEKPSGEIHPLDGFIDPYYQEVYLDAASIPLFSKITRHMSPDSLSQYVRTLEKETSKYTRNPNINYGKVAKRMYNVFRLTGRFEEAAYVRELFDEPAALLYQVNALLDGLIDLGGETQAINRDVLTSQIDDLIRDITTVAEGPSETMIIMSLLKTRDHITGLKNLGDAWGQTITEVQSEISQLVNQYFEEQLRAIPSIASYIDSLE